MISFESLKQNKWAPRLVIGYLLSILCLVGIVVLSFSGLNKISHTVDDITYRLTDTRNLAQRIDSNLQQVRYYADRYQRFYKQRDLDSFYDTLQELRKDQNNMQRLIEDDVALEMLERVTKETKEYMDGFEEITKLIMRQQSLLSTTFIKKELLIEHQLSAIRVNVGVVKTPAIFYAFGNTRNAFDLMRLYQLKYLNSGDEKYFVMFVRKYALANEGIANLLEAVASIHKDYADELVMNVNKAKSELDAYYVTFIDIHSINVALTQLKRKVKLYEKEVIKLTSAISLAIEAEYRHKNRSTQSLVQETKVQLIFAVVIALVFSILALLVILKKIVAPEVSKLKHLSNLDALTQIANRRGYEEHMQLEMDNAEQEQLPISLILCDVDYFKNYNDEYGHQMGDKCLQQVAQLFKESCLYSDDFVARYGGEEFVFILPNTNTDKAVRVASRLKRDISALKIEHIGSPIKSYITISCGVACIEAGGNYSTQELLKHADTALYDAKNKNRNCVVLHS